MLSNIAAATVNTSGVVTAVSAGTATITARSNSNQAVMDTCTVNVTDPEGCNAMDIAILYLRYLELLLLF